MFSHRIISVCAPWQEIESTLSGSSFAGLFILLRGLAFCSERKLSLTLFGNIFYIHAGALPDPNRAKNLTKENMSVLLPTARALAILPLPIYMSEVGMT